MKSKNTFFESARRGGCLFSLIKFFVLAAIILGIALYFCLGKVADYALKTITNGTSIAAGIGTIKINPFQEYVSVDNFYITNPSEFGAKGNAIAFKHAVIDADISVSEYLSDKFVDMDEVTIEGLEISFLVKEGSIAYTNIDAIIDILKQRAGIEEGKKTSAPANQNTATTSEKKDSKPMKIAIKKLVFKDAIITSGYGADLVKIPLPSFEMKDLGVKENGVTPTELAIEILGTLSKKATIGVAKQITKDGWGKTKEETGKAVDKIKDSIKGLFKK